MQALQARFTVVNDLLAEAERGSLKDHGKFVVENSGRIGPLVELLSAATSHPGEFKSVSLAGSFANRLKESWACGIPFGGSFGDIAGAFPLPSENPVITRNVHWEQWLLHAENVAKANGVHASLVASLIGALGEMQDNVYEHSGADQTGLVAYAVTNRSFEFVVADRGIGVLETLRQNPEYAHLTDSGMALTQAIRPGVSRFPSASGRGQGFVQLCRSMVTNGVELRFRSGDHSLSLSPTDDPLDGDQRLIHTSTLAGMTISAFWRAQTP